MKLSKKELSELEIVLNSEGFTIWVTEPVIYSDGTKGVIHHWIIDGSTVKETGEITFGNPDIYNINAEFMPGGNSIIISKKRKKIKSFKQPKTS